MAGSARVFGVAKCFSDRFNISPPYTQHSLSTPSVHRRSSDQSSTVPSSTTTTTTDTVTPHEHHLSSGSQGSVPMARHHQQHPLHSLPAAHPPPASASSLSSPKVWLCRALQGGILFAQLSFMPPFFCLRIFTFYAAPQLDEHLRPNQLERVCLNLQKQLGSKDWPNLQKNCARMKDNVHWVRELEHAKNELIRQSHVHSFVYDFHLRMVGRYLVGDKQVRVVYKKFWFFGDGFYRNFVLSRPLPCPHLPGTVWTLLLFSTKDV